MKVLLMVPEMELGGVEEGTYDLAIGLKNLGIEPIVVSGPGYYIQLLKEKNIKWYNLPTFKKNPVSFIFGYLKLKKILRKEKPEILHCRSRFPAWIAYYALKFLPKTHFITSIHGFYKKRYYSKILGKGERVIVISKSLEKYANRFLKVPSEKIRVVYNGVKFEPFINLKKNYHTGFIIGGIGRFTEVKGFQYLLFAVKKINKKIPNIKVFLIGKGGYKKHLEKLVLKLNLENVYFFEGKSFEFLPYFDVIIAPHISTEESVNEDFVWTGRVCIEAQLAGIPVITSLNGIENGNFLKTSNTIFVPPKDSESLAKSIIYIFENQEEVLQMCKNAKEFAIKNFSIDKMVKNTLEVYKEVLKM